MAKKAEQITKNSGKAARKAAKREAKRAARRLPVEEKPQPNRFKGWAD